MLSAELGVPYDPKDQAAYISSWIKVVRNDENKVFNAAADASKAYDFNRLCILYSHGWLAVDPLRKSDSSVSGTLRSSAWRPNGMRIRSTLSRARSSQGSWFWRAADR
jgi:hypothetical protein